MTDTQGLRIRSWLATGSGLRVGKDAHGRLCVAALRGRARRGARGRPRTESGTRSIAVRRPGATRASSHACGPSCRPSRICPPRGGTARSGARRRRTVAPGRAERAHMRAPKRTKAEPARGRSRGGFGTQIPLLADRRDRPLRLRVTGGPRPDRTQARALGEDGMDAPLPCPITDRAYDRDGFRAGRAQRAIKAVLPARRGRTHPQPHDPERYPARKVVARSIGGLKQGRRVATRYAPYA